MGFWNSPKSLGRPKDLCFFGRSPKARDRPAALGMSQHRGV